MISWWWWWFRTMRKEWKARSDVYLRRWRHPTSTLCRIVAAQNSQDISQRLFMKWTTQMPKSVRRCKIVIMDENCVLFDRSSWKLDIFISDQIFSIYWNQKRIIEILLFCFSLSFPFFLLLFFPSIRYDKLLIYISYYSFSLPIKDF